MQRDKDTYVVSSDGAGGVSGDELELHVDPAEQVLLLGLEARPRHSVEGQRQELTPIEDLGAVAATPSDVKVLVEVPSCWGSSSH